MRTSEGWDAGPALETMLRAPAIGAGPWTGMRVTRWFDAEAGVRKSKILRWESEETEDTIEGEWGENAVLYVQEWVGMVRREDARLGFHYERKY